MALTNEDIQKIQTVVDGAKAELMTELDKKPDKADLDRLETRLTTALGLVERDHGSRLDDLEVRVGKLEQAAQ